MAITLARLYGNLSWFLIFDERFDEAEKAAKTGLGLSGFVKSIYYDEKTEWIHTNLALALLYQDKFEEAKQIYERFIGLPFNDEQTWVEAFLSDLDELEMKGITHPDVEKIRELLNQ